MGTRTFFIRCHDWDEGVSVAVQMPAYSAADALVQFDVWRKAIKRQAEHITYAGKPCPRFDEAQDIWPDERPQYLMVVYASEGRESHA